MIYLYLWYRDSNWRSHQLHCKGGPSSAVFQIGPNGHSLEWTSGRGRIFSLESEKSRKWKCVSPLVPVSFFPYPSVGPIVSFSLSSRNGFGQKEVVSFWILSVRSETCSALRGEVRVSNWILSQKVWKKTGLNVSEQNVSGLNLSASSWTSFDFWIY